MTIHFLLKSVQTFKKDFFINFFWGNNLVLSLLFSFTMSITAAPAFSSPKNSNEPIFLSSVSNFSTQKITTRNSITKEQMEKRINWIQKSFNFDQDSDVHLLSFQERGPNRLLVQVTRGNVDRIQLLIKGPNQFWENSKLPILFVSSGFEAGSQTIELVNEIPGVILVGMDYAVKKSDIEKDPSLFFKTIHNTPGQVVAALQWLSKQPWYDSKKGIFYIGISLGTLFLPVSVKLAEKNGIQIQSEILGFAGVDMQKIFQYHLSCFLGAKAGNSFSSFLSLMTEIYEPQFYLPYLNSSHLVIQATQDQVFPKESIYLLNDLVPEPKELVWIEGAHIDVDRPEVILPTIQVIKSWISKQIAIHP